MVFQPVSTSPTAVTSLADGTDTKVAVAPNGDFVVVWAQPIGGEVDIYFRRYFANGTPKDASPRATAQTGFLEINPDIAIAADGSFVITYARSTSTEEDVFFQRYDPNGIPLGTAIQAQATLPTGQRKVSTEPKIAMYDNGDFVLYYSLGFTGGYPLESYRRDGTFERGISIGSNIEDIDVVPIRNDNGTSIVLALEGDTQVGFQRFNGNLVALGSHQGSPGPKTAYDPSIAVDPVGNIILTWTEIYGTGDNDIRYRKFSSDGTPITSSLSVDTSLNNQERSSVAIANDGRFVVAHQDFLDFESNLHEFSADGTRVGSTREFVSSPTVAPQVAVSGNGKHLVLAFDPSLTGGAPRVWVFQTPNAIPTDIRLSNTSVAENQPANAIVGTLTTVDADPSDTFVYSLIDGPGGADNAAFAIVGNTLQAKQPFDFESKSFYSIRVRTNDGYGGILDKQFSIAVSDVAEQTTDRLIGNAKANLLVGDVRDNFIWGKGGNDNLTGGAGRDKFVFNMSAPFNKSVIGVDVINDFTPGVDKIVLDRTTFTKLRGFVLQPDQFASVGTVQQAKNSRAAITYVRSTGALFYNENLSKPGFGAGGQFADLTNGLPLKRGNISVVA